MIVPLIGDGTDNSPYRPDINLSIIKAWTDNGDGTATVMLTDDMALRVRNFAASAADALNGGSAWSALTAIRPDSLPLTLVKQDLVDTVKMTYTERLNQAGSVPQGFVVAHDNSATKGLWRADVDTTAEPTKDSAEWTLVFEVTV
jgi:hypothetical protein